MFDKILQSLAIAMTVVIFLPSLSVAQDDVATETRRITAPSSMDRPYEVLLIRKKDNQVQAFDPSSDKVVFKEGRDRGRTFELIELALYNARITAVVGSTFQLERVLEIPTSYTSLIVGPEATLTGTEPGAIGRKPPVESNEARAVIENIRRDHVNIFHLGTLDSGVEGMASAMVYFDGRSGGKTGINGGLLFGVGRMKGNNLGHWIVDTKNVHAPLLWAKQPRHAVLAAEGNEDLQIGLAAALQIKEQGGQSETIDLNSHNKRTHIEHVIGTFVEGQDEILDVNNSPATIIDKVVGYGEVDISDDEAVNRSGHSELVSFQKYTRPQRRKTQKDYIDNNSTGSRVHDASIVRKNVKEWKTTVETPGFPDSLPVFKVNVRLKAVYEDGSSEQVFARNYRFNL